MLDYTTKKALGRTLTHSCCRLNCSDVVLSQYAREQVLFTTENCCHQPVQQNLRY